MSRPVSCSRAAQRSTDSASGSSSPQSDSTCSSRSTAVASTRSACRLVDVVAHFHGAHAAHARILVGESAHQVVEQPFAHGAFGHADTIDAEILDHLQAVSRARRETPARAPRRRRSRSNSSTWPAAMTRSASMRKLSSVMCGDSGFSRCSTSLMTRTVPELPNACSQPILRYASCMGSSSSLTAVRARSSRFAEILPSSKKLALNPTQPTDRLSSSKRIEALADHDLGRAAADVDHQRLSGLIGLVCTTPE